MSDKKTLEMRDLATLRSLLSINCLSLNEVGKLKMHYERGTGYYLVKLRSSIHVHIDEIEDVITL